MYVTYMLPRAKATLALVLQYIVRTLHESIKMNFSLKILK